MSWNQTQALARHTGLGIHQLIRTRRTVAVYNLLIAFPSLAPSGADQLARAASVNFVRSMFHFLRFPALAKSELARRVELQGWQHYEQAAGRQRGVVILTAHLGNWELLGARLVAAGAPLAGIARERSNSTVGHIMRATRTATGMVVLDKDEGLLAGVRWLKQGNALGVLPDQHASWQGAPLEFFGRVTPMHTVVARLTRTTGCAVLPCYCTWEADRYVARVYPELEMQRSSDKDADLLENTRRMIRVLEAQIRAYPDQWLWVHKRWRDNDHDYVRYHQGDFTRAEWAAAQTA